jgi:hypothetical protein
MPFIKNRNPGVPTENRTFCPVKSRHGERNVAKLPRPVLGATIKEREGSRIGVVLFGEIQVFHRPHLTPTKELFPVFENGWKEMG